MRCDATDTAAESTRGSCYYYFFFTAANLRAVRGRVASFLTSDLALPFPAQREEMDGDLGGTGWAGGRREELAARETWTCSAEFTKGNVRNSAAPKTPNEGSDGHEREGTQQDAGKNVAEGRLKRRVWSRGEGREREKRRKKVRGPSDTNGGCCDVLGVSEVNTLATFVSSESSQRARTRFASRGGGERGRGVSLLGVRSSRGEGLSLIHI